MLIAQAPASMPAHGPFSPEMISVYLSFLTLLTFAVKAWFEQRAKNRDRESARLDLELRRKWEIEDRQYKAELAKQQAEVKKAAIASARLAEQSKKEIGEKIESSRVERLAQLNEVKASVEESKNASAAALEAANGHNAKILQATEIANAAMATAAEAKATPTPPPGQS